MAFWDNLYYGNTVSEWMIALGIILGAVVLGKFLYLIFGKVFKSFTGKTKTKLDDILIDMLEEPAVLAFILGAMWYAVLTLNLSEGAVAFFNNVFWSVVILNVAWFLTRFVEAIIEEYIKPMTEKSDTDFDDQVLPIARKGLKIAIWVLAIIVALNNAGYNISAILAGLGIGGLAFALAAKDLLANIFGGVMIFFDKPFKLRDRIRISGFDGEVKEIGLRSTKLVTLDGTEVTIPNSTFTDSPVENVSREPARKVTLNLGLTYDTKPKDMEKAMKILEKIALKHNDKIWDEFKLAFNSFGDFSLGILFVYHIRKKADILQTQTAINLDILREFNKAGLSMAFPTQTVEVVRKK